MLLGSISKSWLIDPYVCSIILHSISVLGPSAGLQQLSTQIGPHL